MPGGEAGGFLEASKGESQGVNVTVSMDTGGLLQQPVVKDVPRLSGDQTKTKPFSESHCTPQGSGLTTCGTRALDEA